MPVRKDSFDQLKKKRTTPLLRSLGSGFRERHHDSWQAASQPDKNQ